jgi:hypothetical protein
MSTEAIATYTAVRSPDSDIQTIIESRAEAPLK